MSELHSQIPPVVTIETERLQLKTLVMEDLDDLMPQLTDLRVMRWTSKPPMETREQGEQWLRARCLGPDIFNFAIRERSIDGTTQKVIGVLGCSQGPGEIGYKMNWDYMGKGYATEALKAFIPVFFARTPPASEGGTGVDVITAYIDVENLGSQRVLEKSGFQLCETVGDQQIYVQDNPHNKMTHSHIFRIARPGMSLRELGLVVGGEEDKPPMPPVQ